MPGKAPQKVPAFSKVLADCETTNPRYAAFLKSWQQHPDKDKLWQAVQVAAQAGHRILPIVPDFIGVVLSSTASVKSLNDHNDLVREQFEKLKRKIAGVVADADYPLDLLRDLPRFEQPLRDLGRSAFDILTPAGGRKDQNGSRDRKAFVHRMFHYLHNTCGQYPQAAGIGRRGHEGAGEGEGIGVAR
jgi:hypothetical protein